MNIFISNDDGVESNGLIMLAERLKKENNILIVAPDGNRSVCSHSLTIRKPIKLIECNAVEGVESYKISGTPADCVKLLSHYFKDFKADVVVSGINKAHNIGSDIFYSGTVAIAYEAAYYGYVAFAFSAYSLGESPFELYSEYADKIIKMLYPLSRKGTIWNVNFPDVDKTIKGIKITKLGNRTFDDEYRQISADEFMLHSTDVILEECDDVYTDCDLYWVRKGYITVTPLVYDRTDYTILDELKKKCVRL